MQRLHENDLVGELLHPELKLTLSRWSSEQPTGIGLQQVYFQSAGLLNMLLRVAQGRVFRASA